MDVSTRIDGGDESLLNLECRELVLLHIHKTEDSPTDEQKKK